MLTLRIIRMWLPLSGCAFLLAWLLLTVNGVAWLSYAMGTSIAAVHCTTHVFLGFSVAMLTLSFLRFARAHESARIRAFIGSVLMCGGVALIVVSSPDWLERPLFLQAGSLFAGVGLAFLVKMQLHQFLLFNSLQLAFSFSFVAVLSILLYFVVNSCPSFLGIILIVLMPCLAAILFCIYEKNSCKLETQEIFESTNEGTFDSGKTSGEVASSSILPQIGIALFSMWLCVVVQRTYYLTLFTIDITQYCFAVGLVILLVVLVVLLVLLFRQERRFITLKNVHVGACVVLLAVLLSVSLTLEHQIIVGSCFAASFFLLGLYGYLFIVAWSESLLRQKRNVVILLFVAVIVACFLLMPYYVDMFFPEFEEFLQSQSFVLMVLTGAILVLLTCVVTSNNVLDLPGKATLFEDQVPSEPYVFRGWEETCEAVARKYSLSSREKEVLGLLVQGYKNDNISKQLYISISTVRTHVRNLHSKLEVHSHSELMTLLGEERVEGK